MGNSIKKFFLLPFVSLILLFFFGNAIEIPSEKALEFFYGKIYRTSRYDGITFDGNKMPLIDYKSHKGIHIGIVYNPLVVGWKTDEIMKKPIKIREDTLEILNYAEKMMLDSYGFEDSSGLLRYSFCWPRCGIKDYFYSSLGQGRAILVEISAFKMSNDSIYLRNAGKLMKGFFADIENDGIRKALNDSSWWYEEYASKSIPVCFVLNGMASSVLCLNEYFQITKDAASETLVNFGINGIIEKIHEFDREGYMFYDLQGNVCSPFYERYTISLLEKIIQIKDNVTIRKYIEKWTKYQNETPYPIKALKHPTKRSMGMLAFQFIFFLTASAILYFFIHLFSERR